MEVTYRNLPKIRFPVYLLPTDSWYLRDGILFLESKVLDDKNMPGTSLGQRRLQTPHKNNLATITKSVNTLPALLKQKTRLFIDYNGVPFIYTKTLMSKLKYYKILKIIPKGKVTILKVEGISSPFTVPRPPARGMYYAGVLHLHGLPWMLYEYSPNKKEDTQRKV